MHFLSSKANDNTFPVWNHFFLFLRHIEAKNKIKNNMRRNKVLKLLKRTFVRKKKKSGHQNTYTNPWRRRILISKQQESCSIWSKHQNYYKQYLISLMVLVNFYLSLPHYCIVLTGQHNSCIHIRLLLWPHTPPIILWKEEMSFGPKTIALNIANWKRRST